MPSKTTVKIVDRKTGKPSKNFDYAGSATVGKAKTERQSKGGETAYRTKSPSGNQLFPKTINDNVKRAFKAKKGK